MRKATQTYTSSHIHQLILASSSPRRKELVALLDLPVPVSVFSIDVDEHIHSAWQPAEAVEQLSLAKARAVAQAIKNGETPQALHSNNALILAADTIVVLEDQILGKPISHEDAAATLRKLSGRSHHVYTGVVLQHIAVDENILNHSDDHDRLPIIPLGDIGQYRIQHHNDSLERIIGYSCSKVTFKSLSEEEIQAYIRTGEPLDKAGSYGVQGIGSVFIERIEGDFYSIMGLPLNLLYQMLLKFGVSPFDSYY